MFTSARHRPAAGRFLILGALLAGGGCSDDRGIFDPLPGPGLGWLSVSTITTGGEFDADGYLIRVSSSGRASVDLNAKGAAIDLNATRYFYGLTPGDLSVVLMDVAPNCSVSGDGEQIATIVAGVAAPVTFTLACTPRSELATVRLLFSRAGASTQLYAVNGNGTALTQLTSDAFENYSPALSPDGKKIAFVSDRDGVLITYNDPFEGAGEYREGRDVYVMNADGTGIVRLTMSGVSGDPAWSPDGTRIAFASAWGIRIAGTDDTNSVELTNNPQDHTPAWSPDGSRIAFTRADPSVRGAPQTARIWIVDADGTGPTPLTDFHSSGPVWSPDGGKIAFTGFSPADSGGQVYIMNSDGSGAVRLTSGDLEWQAGGYSVDGRIALLATRYWEGDLGRSGYYATSIYVMDPDGSIARLTAGRGTYESSPTFWPQPSAAGRQ